MTTKKATPTPQKSDVLTPAGTQHNHIKAIKRPHLAHTKNEQEFKGYTLDEIRYMKVVNTLKINLVQDQLMMTFSPRITSEAQTVAGYMRYFETSMKYADIAIMAYNMFRRMRTWFNRRKQ